MRARSLLCGCLLFGACLACLACRRGTLSGDGGAGTIEADASSGDGRARDATVVDARSANAVWAAWPLVDHDPANTRRSPYVGPQAPVDRMTLDVLARTLVIGGDGTLYMTDWGDTHPIVAVDPATGARRWSFAPTPSVPTTVPPSSPTIAVGPEGNLYVAYQQGAFYALDRDGAVRWQFTTGKTAASGDLSMFSPPLVDSSGRVYVGESTVVYAFESDGRRAWQSDLRSILAAVPAGVAADGTLYVRESYGALHAFGRDGSQRWTLPSTTAVPSVSGLAVRADGTLLCAGLGDRHFGVIDAGGAVLWQKPGQLGSFALASDGAAYTTDATGVLRLDHAGSTVWQAAAGGYSAIVDADGTVYSGGQGSLAAVDAGGILKWELRTGDAAIPGSALWTPTPLAIGADGTLYAAINGSIHAIGGGGRCEGRRTDCDDQDPCTIDRCDPQVGCVHAPKCASPGRCTGAGCALDGTCSFAIAFDGTACDDGVACSEGDACRAGQCVPRTSACALAGAWPAAGHDAQHTHATTLLGPAAPALKWASPVPGVFTFVVSGDGTIFATGSQGLQSISTEGVATPLAAVPALELALRGDGGLYARTYETTSVLRALGPDGALQWSFDVTPVSAPAVGPSGAVYAATRHDLIALAPDGSTLWTIPTGGGFGAPAVGPDGTVYALSPDLWAISPDGRVKWKHAVGWGGPLVVGPTGTAYVLVDSGVRAIDASGADAWSWSLGAYATFEPALSASGDLLLIGGPTIYRLDASTGALRSSLTLPPPALPGPIQYDAQHLTSPVVDGDGVLYVAANATDSSFQPMTQVTIYAIDRNDQVLWTAPLVHNMGASSGTMAIGPGRTLYVTISNKLYAIGP